MKVSINWLKELVDLNCSFEELVNLLPLRSISIKERTDDYIELDMKGYNRADFLSLRGVAQEVAAITKSELLFDESEDAKYVWNQTSLPKTKVSVERPESAPYYTITKIEGLKVNKSSPEIQKKLLESGVRSIDSVTDITNLIMIEYGQPMHAFDSRTVQDETIIVRGAKKGERITTLDEKTRDLEEDDLLIADPLNAIGLAGVMGGKDSEINESTSTILLEAAIFDSATIRKTSSRLGLQSEAGKRFQHGLTKKRLLQALKAAIKMCGELGGKVTAINMVGNFEDKTRKIILTKKKLEDLVGVKFEDKQVEDYLQRLGFTLASKGQALRAWEVEVPYWRLDINIEEDLIEEVTRLYGYEKIPAQVVSQSRPLQKEGPIFPQISDLKQKLVSLGLTEVQTYSFYSTQVIKALGWDNKLDEYLVKIANPISSETEYLRRNIWPNLVEVIGKNMRKGYRDIGIFEIGKAFNIDPSGNPAEECRIAIALSNETDNPIEELISIAKKAGLDMKLKQGSSLAATKDSFHPKRQIGNLAEVHLRVLNRLGIDKRVAVFEAEIS